MTADFVDDGFEAVVIAKADGGCQTTNARTDDDDLGAVRMCLSRDIEIQTFLLPSMMLYSGSNEDENSPAKKLLR